MGNKFYIVYDNNDSYPWSLYYYEDGEEYSEEYVTLEELFDRFKELASNLTESGRSHKDQEADNNNQDNTE